MVSSTNSEIRAADVYLAWKKRVESAQLAVVLFTPFLDSLAEQLVDSAGVPPSAFTVVTDLSPESGAVDYLGQLKALRSLMDRGVAVKSLERLHAKVLVVDGTVVTSGSQNFTRYARKSKECTTVTELVLAGTRLGKTLTAWETAAADVSVDYVDFLLLQLEQQAKTAETAHRELVEAFGSAAREYLKVERLATRKRWDEVAKQSTVKFSQEFLFARLSTVQSSGSADYYLSLLVEDGGSLTSWKHRATGAVEEVELKRFNMYPVILTGSGEMGFGRLAKTRISYVRRSVAWKSNSLVVGGMASTLSVSFPRDQLTRRNVIVGFKTISLERLTCNVELKFDGANVRVVAASFGGTGTPPANFRAYSVACREFFEDPTVQEEHFRRFVLTPFKFKEVGLDQHDAEEFFRPRVRYRVRLVEFSGSRILAFTDL